MRFFSMAMTILRNLWGGLKHEHAVHVRTVWGQAAAGYCWVCSATVTDTPVVGYAIVHRKTGEIVIGSRDGVPCKAFFIDLSQAEAVRLKGGINRYEVAIAYATKKPGIRLLNAPISGDSYQGIKAE